MAGRFPVPNPVGWAAAIISWTNFPYIDNSVELHGTVILKLFQGGPSVWYAPANSLLAVTLWGVCWSSAVLTPLWTRPLVGEVESGVPLPSGGGAAVCPGGSRHRGTPCAVWLIHARS